jgi:hypothetical protein
MTILGRCSERFVTHRFRMKLSICCVGFCAVLLFSCSIAIGQHKSKPPAEDVVQIRCDGNIGQFPITPMEMLFSSLRQHPKGNLFRVS